MQFKRWFENTQKAPDGYRGVLIIMRGTQGSGKSFTALKLANGDRSKVFSSDDWFEQQPGGFNFRSLTVAHKWNQDRVRTAMQIGITPIIVDNANRTVKEAMPYIEMSQQYQYYPEIKESDSPWWQTIKTLLKNKQRNAEEIRNWAHKLATGFQHGDKTIKNTHGVPENTILRYLRSYHPYSIDDVLKHRS